MDLSASDLLAANLRESNLTGADLRSANLQRANLDDSTLTDARLWESQRAGWSINRIVCERVFWDQDGDEPTIYEAGEFEKLHSDQTCIELFYRGGVSSFELNTLPALLHHLASLHPETTIRLKSIEETGGGAKISISVADSDPDTVDNVRSDAEAVYHAQLALRENENLRLETEKKYLESFVSERLIKSMLSAAAQQNVFNAPVYGAALSSGNSSAVVHQTVNDEALLLALLESMLQHENELLLERAKAESFHAEVEAAKAELEKPEPRPSVLLRSLKFLQKVVGEAVSKAAGKLGEDVVSADWSGWLHQLNNFVAHIK